MNYSPFEINQFKLLLRLYNNRHMDFFLLTKQVSKSNREVKDIILKNELHID